MLGKIKDDAEKALDFAQQISSNSREGNRMWLNKTKNRLTEIRRFQATNKESY